jgi:hypothetical protein
MTRIIIGLLVVVLLVGSGCSDKDSVPAGILPHEKMEAVMWDVVQAEQYSSNYLAKDSAHIDLKLENLRLYDEVFRLHQVSRDEFRKSYKYYLSRADLAQVLFDSLLAKGNRLRSESYSRPSRPMTTNPAQAPPPSAKGSPVSPALPLKVSDSSRRLPAVSRRLSDSGRRRRMLPLLKRSDSVIMDKKNPS